MTEIWSKPTTYTVCAVPETVDGWEMFALSVDEAAPGLWAVRWRSRCCLNRDGEFEWEPLPSERDDEFLGRCRFDLDTALDMARRMAPGLRCNGVTAERAAVEWAEGA